MSALQAADLQAADARIKIHELGLGLLSGVVLTTGEEGVHVWGYPPRNPRRYEESEIRSALGNGDLYFKEVLIPGSSEGGVLYWVESPYTEEENLWGQIFGGVKIEGQALLVLRGLAPLRESVP